MKLNSADLTLLPVHSPLPHNTRALSFSEVESTPCFLPAAVLKAPGVDRRLLAADKKNCSDEYSPMI